MPEVQPLQNMSKCQSLLQNTHTDMHTQTQQIKQWWGATSSKQQFLNTLYMDEHSIMSS